MDNIGAVSAADISFDEGSMIKKKRVHDEMIYDILWFHQYSKVLWIFEKLSLMLLLLYIFVVRYM